MPSPVPVKKTDESPLTWGEACDAALIGRKIARAAWGDGSCVLLHASALHLRKADGSLHTLIVSEGDLANADWQIVREH